MAYPRSDPAKILGGNRSGRLMDVKETAAYLGKSEKSLRNYWKLWGLQPIRVGRELRFRVRDVEAWIESRRESA